MFDLYHAVISVFICNFLTGHCWKNSIVPTRMNGRAINSVLGLMGYFLPFLTSVYSFY
jgi:hypothetical protein